MEQSEKILSPVSSADLKTLSWHAFDQTPGQYWRKLADQKRFAEAAELIEAYLALHPELDEGAQKVNGANVHFHAAQCWAFADRTAEASKHLTLSRNDPQWEVASGLNWNDYVSGTEAFLRGDRETLQAMRERLANAPDTNQPNLAVLDRLIANFGRPYAARTALAAPTSNRPRRKSKARPEPTKKYTHANHHPYATLYLGLGWIH
jgi:hypothetical protein